MNCKYAISPNRVERVSVGKRSTLRYSLIGAFVAVVASAGCNGPLTRPSSPAVEPFPTLTDSSFGGSMPPDYAGRFAGTQFKFNIVTLPKTVRMALVVTLAFEGTVTRQ